MEHFKKSSRWRSRKIVRKRTYTLAWKLLNILIFKNVNWRYKNLQAEFFLPSALAHQGDITEWKIYLTPPITKLLQTIVRLLRQLSL